MNCEDCVHEKVCEGYSNCEEAGLYEPKRPHGEWKRISMDKYIRHASCFYRCSVCGEDTIGETNFCPNCGADMRKERG